MKYLLFISLLALYPLYGSIVWTPAASIAVLWEGNAYGRGIAPSGTMLSSIAASADADVLSFTIDGHRISLPVYAAFTSASLVHRRLQRLPSLEAGIGIGYARQVNSFIELGCMLSMAMRWMDKADAGEWIAGGRIHASFSILPCISLTIPMWILGGRSGISVRTGAGVAFRYGGTV